MTVHDMTIRDLVRTLAGILEEQAIAVRKLAKDLRGERENFLSVRGGGLEALHSRLEERAAESLDLEARRRECVVELCRRLGIGLSNPRVSLLAAALETGLARPLSRAARRAKEAAEELEVELRVGRDLLEWSASCQEGLVRSLTGEYAEVGYGPDGRKTRNGTSLLDARV